MAVRILSGHPEAVDGYIIFHGLHKLAADDALELAISRALPTPLAVYGKSDALMRFWDRFGSGVELCLVPTGKEPSAALRRIGVVSVLRERKPSVALAEKWLARYGLDKSYSPHLAHLTEYELNTTIISAMMTGRSKAALPAGWDDMLDGMFFQLAGEPMCPWACTVLSMAPGMPLELASAMALYMEMRGAVR
jgi:hypothetical protein